MGAEEMRLGLEPMKAPEEEVVPPLFPLRVEEDLTFDTTRGAGVLEQTAVPPAIVSVGWFSNLVEIVLDDWRGSVTEANRLLGSLGLVFLSFRVGQTGRERICFLLSSIRVRALIFSNGSSELER